MSFNTTKDTYNRSFRMYDRISDMWAALESGQSKNVEYDVDLLLKDLNIFSKLVEKIYVNDLKGKIPQEKLDQVIHNKELFREAMYYILRSAKGIKYNDEIRGPVMSYILKLKPLRSEYKEIAQDEKELAKKFAGALTHPDNITDLELKLKRIANGTMSLNEFSKIFNAYLGYIPQPKKETGEFQPLSDYKSRNRTETEEQRRNRVSKWAEANKKAGVKTGGEPKEKPAYGFRIKK